MMMAVAGWMIWERLPYKGFSLPMALFFVQLILNVGWSALFFGLRSPGLAFLEIILLWIYIALTVIRFWGVSWVAGALLVPYLVWVSFASVLNFFIWKLNTVHE